MHQDESADEVLRKIGRNLFIIQQVESLLKLMVSQRSLTGFLTQLARAQKLNTDRVNKQTMGQLVGQYLELIDPSKAITELADISHIATKEIVFSSQTRIVGSPNYYLQKQTDLAKMVEDRNNLIHHLLPRLNLQSKESCQEIGQQLDDQRAGLVAQLEELKAQLLALAENRQVMCDFLASDQAKEMFERVEK
ncbi:MAG: hypothetical protein U0998_10750 [Moraxellaceae bacterium]|nr:hypothetical protein [Moraxellaceae bacterium]MDZ4387650.1 hypothetical protein [Moraxellaceae bacterium]